MKELKYVVKDQDGIHARPAGELVKLAKTFSSQITMKKEDKTADCKKIFTVMALGVKCGNEIRIQFDGEDEETAVSAFETFLNENL